MTAKDDWNNRKTEFQQKFQSKIGAGYLYRGATYNIEVPVDKTSKYIIPVDGIIMHILDFNDEPTEVKNNLTIWSPPPRSSSEG